jgi:hypothetical protein
LHYVYLEFNEQELLTHAGKVKVEVAKKIAKEDGLVKAQLLGWLSKKRQMRGAQISRNEACLGTPQ